MQHRHSFIRVILLVLLFINQVHAANPDQSHVLKDLNYGAALFELYQDRYYSAAVSLLTSQESNKLTEHHDEAELLLGSMYLYYGMHDEAEEIFARHTSSHNTSKNQQRAWFYLAKLRYQRGLLDEAQQALAKISTRLESPLEEERQQLTTMLLLKQQRYEEAVPLLEKLDQQDILNRYNLAVALEQSGSSQKSRELLTSIITQYSTTAFENDLQQKVKVALAQQYINNKQYQPAKQLLQQFSFENIYANQALIALAWAKFLSEEPASAIAPLRALHKAKSSDLAVQESYLFYGYVQEQGHSYLEAKTAYEDAISQFNSEISKVDDALVSLEDGRFLNELLPQLKGKSQGWGWEGELTPPKSSGPFLVEMIASNDFYEALKNLRDLAYLKQQLDEWREILPSYQHMLELRQQRYKQLLPMLNLIHKSDQIALFKEKRDTIATKIARIKQHRDIYSLTSDDEDKQLQAIQSAKKTVPKITDKDMQQQYQERIDRLSGLLTWDLSSNFEQRLWDRQKELNKLDNIIDTLELQKEKLKKESILTPEKFADYQNQIIRLRQQIDGATKRCEDKYETQQGNVLALAQQALIKHREILSAYRDQAYYRLARVKDIAINQLKVN